MANLTHPELAEITATAFPPATEDNLKDMRNRLCGTQGDFQLQSQQKFLRRVLSPDSPTRNLLAVHGTGVGKTCTAIQIAEEYILRPEFQDKRVLVITSPAVQENFESELFRLDRVELVKDNGNNIVSLLSQQCTGRRYLDMLLRIQPDINNWENPAVRTRLERMIGRILDEFYEFMGYNEFADLLNTRLGSPADAVRNAAWVAETFGNRLVIIDEAHNIREIEEENGGTARRKGVSQALERLTQTAEGMVLVLLTATPMYDNYEEIVFYMNLFLWNDRKQKASTKLKPTDFFNDDATLKEGNEAMFRQWCQTYVSFVKGESPFTFPFRLPSPEVPPVPSNGFDGKEITEPTQYIRVTPAVAQGVQATVLADKPKNTEPTIAVLPNKFDSVFKTVGSQYDYVDADKPVLKPEFLPNISAKFVNVLRILEESTGVVMVYSNFRKMGSDLFAMALEEHGYRPAVGNTRMVNPTKASGKKYALLAPETDWSEQMKIIRSRENRDGSRIKVVLTSPATSEGVSFRFIRQVHILDPWWNMSRMEQVAGRAMRTCSHQLLPFEEQNCTIYYHVVRLPEQECYDEFTYRTRVVPKAMSIARVRKVLAESAMDCPLQNQVNTLPEDWKNMVIPQTQSQGNRKVELRLIEMMAPAFTETPDVAECHVTPGVPDPEHVRPLSSYLDVRDEILNKLTRMFVDKPIWDRKQLFGALKDYKPDVVVYTLQNAIASGFRFKDAFNRPALLESHDEMYALAPLGAPGRTMVDRTTEPALRVPRELPEPVREEEKKEEITEIAEDVLDTRRDELFNEEPELRARFDIKVLDGYTFDHKFTPDEKRLYIRSHPDRLPFANRLIVPGVFTVLGNEAIDPPEPLVGRLRTAYNAWVSGLIKRFVEQKAVPFASLTEDGLLTVSGLTADGTRDIDPKRKRFDPIRCGTGTNSKTVMMAFAKRIDSKGVGVSKKAEAGNKDTWCRFTELLAREEHNCFWLTPEERSVLYDNEANRKAFSAEFKK